MCFSPSRPCTNDFQTKSPGFGLEDSARWVESDLFGKKNRVLTTQRRLTIFAALTLRSNLSRTDLFCMKKAIDTTLNRLLEAAEGVFAAKGYRAASLHGICSRAGLDVSIVRHYYGDKERLYAAVMEYSVGRSLRKNMPARNSRVGRSRERRGPEVRLEDWVFGLLSHLLREGGATPDAKLMAWEMTEPTFALDEIVNLTIRPRAFELQSIIRELLGDQASEEDVQLCKESISGQCVQYRHVRPILDRLYPGRQYDDREVRRLADHITKFSLAGIKGLRPARKSIKS